MANDNIINIIIKIVNSIFSEDAVQFISPGKLQNAVRITLTMLIFSFFLWCGLYLPEKIFKDSTLKGYITIPLITLIVFGFLVYYDKENTILRLLSGLSFFIFISLLFGIIIGTSQHDVKSNNSNYQETIKAMVVLPIFFGIILPVALYVINSTIFWDNTYSLLFLGILSLIIYIFVMSNFSKELIDSKDESLFNFRYGPDNFRFLQKYTFSSFAIWISMILTILVFTPPYVDWFYYIPIIGIIVLLLFFTLLGFKNTYVIGQEVEVYYQEKWRPRTIRDIVYKDGFIVSVYVNPNNEDDVEMGTNAFSPNNVRLYKI